MQARIKIRPYSMKLTVTDDRKTFQKLSGYDTDGSCGMSACVGGQFYLGVFDSSVATLIHELTHTCLDVLEAVGINPMLADGEPMAYLMDDLFTEVSNKLWVQRPKRLAAKI